MRPSRTNRGKYSVTKNEREQVECAMRDHLAFLLQLTKLPGFDPVSKDGAQVVEAIDRLVDKALVWRRSVGSGKVGRPRTVPKPAGLIYSVERRGRKHQPNRGPDWDLIVYRKIKKIMTTNDVGVSAAIRIGLAVAEERWGYRAGRLAAQESALRNAFLRGRRREAEEAEVEV